MSLFLITMQNVYKGIEVWVHSKEVVNNVNICVNNYKMIIIIMIIILANIFLTH